jgi:hypothetical protein
MQKHDRYWDADAAFRAVQLKVAITQWLHLHQKEGLYQEEKKNSKNIGQKSFN